MTALAPNAPQPGIPDVAELEVVGAPQPDQTITEQMRSQLKKAFRVAFRKAHAMDFYITKYQGKMMQAITPLFHAMVQGVRRLEQQEQQDEQDRVQSH